MHLAPAIPVLRIFSVDKAKEFYLDFLGFSVDRSLQMQVYDPFGNRLRLCQQVDDETNP
ncbi:glyoxalase superfamily protein [Pseudomonas monteilii]|uniref:glyoxalase superfamily protein n=1 Tax=Pseudomonas monteilii TaxID=76759 RepID=UPI0003104537|nr:glyoxalase superfamily protein [Pseudomonas monteilii]